MHLLPLPLSPPALFVVAGVLVSHVAFYLALVGVHVLATELVGKTAARRSVWLIAIAPFSFFCSVVYTEGLYLALAVWAFVFGERRRWAAACAIAGLASATRIPGAFIGAGLFVEYLRDRGYRLRDIRRDCLWFALAPSGLVAYWVYVGVRFHDVMALPKAGHAANPGAAWLGHISHTWGAFSWAHDAVGLNERLQMVLAWTAALAIVVLSVRVAKRLGPGYALFSLFSLAIALRYTVHGVGRYTTVLFPAFLAASELLGPVAFGAVSTVFVTLCGALLILFSHWFRVL